MVKRSAALLVYRIDGGSPEIFIGHMGGPLWKRRPRGWTLPKGEYADEEAPLDAARREFEEETGIQPPAGEYTALGEVRQAGGKVVSAWAVRGDVDVLVARSNSFTMEWPRGSGRTQAFPEIDEFRWAGPDAARDDLVAAQTTFVDRLLELLEVPPS